MGTPECEGSGLSQKQLDAEAERGASYSSVEEGVEGGRNSNMSQILETVPREDQL